MMRRLIVPGLIIAAMAGFLIWLISPGPAPTADIGGAFTLTDGAGKTVTVQDFRGIQIADAGQGVLVQEGYLDRPPAIAQTLL